MKIYEKSKKEGKKMNRKRLERRELIIIRNILDGNLRNF